MDLGIGVNVLIIIDMKDINGYRYFSIIYH